MYIHLFLGSLHISSSARSTVSTPISIQPGRHGKNRISNSQVTIQTNRHSLRIFHLEKDAKKKWSMNAIWGMKNFTFKSKNILPHKTNIELPKNGGLVQMMFLFKQMIFQVPGFSFQGGFSFEIAIRIYTNGNIQEDI